MFLKRNAATFSSKKLRHSSFFVVGCAGRKSLENAQKLHRKRQKLENCSTKFDNLLTKVHRKSCPFVYGFQHSSLRRLSIV